MNYTVAQIKDILGENLYNICYEFFQEVHERNSKYKILMTRRCFSLYKIFKPILEADGIKNEYGTIITDKAVELYLDEIINSFKKEKNKKNTVVTIFDDIIIYGRTINSLIDKLFNGVTDYSCELIGLLADNVVVRCMVESQYANKIKEVYRDRVIADVYASRKKWRFISSKFSETIKFCDVPNTSYVVSYKFDLLNNKSNLYDNCADTFIENQSIELEKLKINNYIVQAIPEEKFNVFSEFIKTSWIRVYVYKELNVIQFSPLVILKEVDEEQVEIIIQHLIEKCILNSNDIMFSLLTQKHKNYYTNKIQLIILLLSHILLCNYLLSNNIVTQQNIEFDCFDIDEIISLNFWPEMVKELNDITLRFLEIKENDYIFLKNDNKKVDHVGTFLKVLFERAMQDNNAALNGFEERTDGFSKINSKSAFSDEFMPIVLLAIDQGMASMKTIYTEPGLYKSMIYSGEQAFRIMNDAFKSVLPYLSCLENYAKIFGRNEYELYHNFINFIRNRKIEADESLEKLTVFLNILEKSNQEISDIYVPDRFMESNINETLLEEFIRKGC